MRKKYIEIIVFVLFMLSNNCYASIAIPFEMVNGLIIVQAEMNGVTGNYIIDSGANGVLLNESPNASNNGFQSLDALVAGSESHNNTLKIGAFETKDLPAFSTDLSNIEHYVSKTVAGILGCSIFTPFSIAFDFNRSMMIISEQEMDETLLAHYKQLSFTMREELPIVELNINGTSHAFILDSGASAHFIDKSFLKSMPENLNNTGKQKNIVTVGGQNQIAHQYVMEDIKVGEELTSMIVFVKDFSQISESLGIKISGLVSLSELSPDVAYFDLKKSRLYYQ